MATKNVMEFTSANWEQEVVQSDRPVLVDFWATWCGPCRMLTPTIEKLADQYAGKIKIGKLNIDDAQDVAVRYGINSIPRVLLFKGHGAEEPAESITGVQAPATFVSMIDRNTGA
jgi:thioredoxin 1